MLIGSSCWCYFSALCSMLVRLQPSIPISLAFNSFETHFLQVSSHSGHARSMAALCGGRCLFPFRLRELRRHPAWGWEAVMPSLIVADDVRWVANLSAVAAVFALAGLPHYAQDVEFSLHE